jgi:hypothetical protein
MVRQIYFIAIFFLISGLSYNLIAQDIDIQPINPPPGFESVEGPVTGENLQSLTGKGIIQKVNSNHIIISSKLYYIAADIKEKKIESSSYFKENALTRGSIVTFELNNRGELVDYQKIGQIHTFCKIDRISDKCVVCNDQYRKFSKSILFYDINAKKLSRSDLQKGNRVGLTLDSKRHVITIWKVNNFLLY